jgi:hypothetical protein
MAAETLIGLIFITTGVAMWIIAEIDRRRYYNGHRNKRCKP